VAAGHFGGTFLHFFSPVQQGKQMGGAFTSAMLSLITGGARSGKSRSWLQPAFSQLLVLVPKAAWKGGCRQDCLPHQCLDPNPRTCRDESRHSRHECLRHEMDPK